MQDEAVIELHRPAEEHRLVAERRIIERDLHLAEERRERHVDWTIHHDPERAALVVLADEGEGSVVAFCVVRP